MKALTYPLTLASLLGLSTTLYADDDQKLKLNSSASKTTEQEETDDIITVYGQKIPTTKETTTSAISVIDADEIERQQVQNIRDLIQYLPGVDVSNQGNRFGFSGFSIRGIGGNRVAIEVDGAPVASSFSIGSFTNASRDFIDTELTKRVEIVRGPSSILFGSDALGGVVAVSTIDPQDILDGNDLGADLSTQFNSRNDATRLHGKAALQQGDHGFLLSLSGNSESEWQNDELVINDTQDNKGFTLFTKYVYGDAYQGGLKASILSSTQDSDTNINSLAGIQDFTAGFGFPYIIDTESVIGEDSKEQSRVSLEQSWFSPVSVFDTLQWRLYVEEFSTEQRTFESRSTLIGDTNTISTRNRLADYDQRNFGLKTSASNVFGKHTLFYGLEHSVSETEQLRDGVELVTGLDPSSTVGPDNFPVRDFPISTVDTTGAFIQFRTHWFNDAFAIIPGIRYDRYQLDAENDAIFLDDNPGVAVADIDDSEVSRSLGITYTPFEELTFYGQYSEGFRTPPMNSVNVGFTNLLFGYTAIANTDLQSETSDGIEAGIRWQSDKLDAVVSYFKNDYENFIQDFVPVGTVLVDGSDRPILVFQSLNLDSVETEGVEISLTADLNSWLPGLAARFSSAFIDGESQQEGEASQPLNSISPTKYVASLFYQYSDYLDFDLYLTHVEQIDEFAEIDAVTEQFVPDAYTVANINSVYRFNDDLQLRLAINNLFDEEYWNWIDVQGRSVNNVLLEQLKNPGRHFSASIAYRF